MSGTAAASSAVDGLTGLTGLLAHLIGSAGEVGVGLLTFAETVVPPIPSEVVLPLAGFLAQQGRLVLAWVLVASTLGSLAGAWVFYGLGAALGLDRSIRLLSRVPLLDREDLVTASQWFGRHGAGSVFFGRFVPGVRSLISLPAGAQRMNPLTFTLGTAAGSAIWNSALVGAGYALGTQWATVGSWASTASNVVLVVLVVVALLLLVRRSRRRRAGRVAGGGAGASGEQV
ncbi:DedA family protein [Pseudokineococcus basanitobsidens]|uniref:DedA family protein n=1 Tax=Pseudokineococcus basanitobsidens TaxID=1926649 RepID=A0ABU8RFT7_9ACTN